LKTIITCAITGAITTREQTPYLPVTPEEIATSALEAAEAGAAVVHIHVRDPESGKYSMKIELYQETVDLIRKHNTDVLINLTTGPGASYFPTPGNMNQGLPHSRMCEAEERVAHIKLIKPDICSIDFNTMHMANHGVRINHKRVTRKMLEIVQSVGTKPELEIFDSGDFCIAKEFVDEDVIKGNPFWQFAMGVKYGWEANINSLMYAYHQLPVDSLWSAFGVGKQEMPMVAQTCILGGHVRVGMEDNIYVSKGVLAKTNAELVGMAKEIITLLGKEIASPGDARDILLH
jgi:uncharacterized protein (DUF849 family)